MIIENVKTVILTILILMSFALTWELWTYQPEYKLMSNQENLREIKLGQTQEAQSLLLPAQIILHEENKILGTFNQFVMKDAFNQIKETLEIKEVDAVESILNLNDFYNKMDIKNSFEIIFPTDIPKEVFLAIFPVRDNELNINQIDRLIFSVKEKTIHLISSRDNKVVKATFSGQVSKFNRLKPQLTEVELIESLSGDFFYLPKDKFQMEKVTYSFNEIDSSLFKYALFDEPSLVKQYNSNNGEVSYTDFAKALEVFHSDYKIRYINPAPAVYSMEAGDIVLSSIEFVNDHAGWTDDYALFELNKKNQSTTFRLMVNGYPVFTNTGVSTIHQSWRNHEVYEYTRSLLNLRFPVTTKKEYVTLPSGEELFTFLRKEYPFFSHRKLEKVVLGYEQNIEKAMLISFEPSWYIKYDGQWKRVQFQGGTISGLE